METYEQQVVRYLREFFDDGEHDYVQDVKLGEATMTVTVYDKHIGKDRGEVFDLYD